MGKRDRFELVGNTIAGTFRVDELVAEGGFGVVYRAFHLHFRSPVALKCLKIPDELSDEERHEFLEQFRSEAEIMFRLSTSLPNVVRPLHVDAVETNSGDFVPLMALEWLDGRSFEAIIHERKHAGKRPMPLSEAVELITPAAQALDAAHHFESVAGSMGVVHRDIKPDNLFLTEVGGRPHVKILDFGISKVRRAATELAGHASQTSGQAPFSPAYGAPEQWVPKRYGQTGPWTDVWGLALTLVEVIKGDAVIVGDHQAMMGTALDPDVRPTPRTEGVEVCDEVERVFKKALATDPRFRYQSVKAFWESLQHALEIGGDPTAAVETESGSRIALPPMIAPTPWTAPPISESLMDDEDLRLPPMLDPAPLEKSQPEELAMAASYPNNPESGLAPVLAAAHSQQPGRFDIPQLDEDDEVPLPEPLEPEASDTTRMPTPVEPLPLELQPTSVFPPAGATGSQEVHLELATEELTPIDRPLELETIDDDEPGATQNGLLSPPSLGVGKPPPPPSAAAHAGPSPLASAPSQSVPRQAASYPDRLMPSSSAAPAGHSLSPRSTVARGSEVAPNSIGRPGEPSHPVRPGGPARRVVTRKESSQDLPAVPDLTLPEATKAHAAGKSGRPSSKGSRRLAVGAPMAANVSRPPPPRRVPSAPNIPAAGTRSGSPPPQTQSPERRGEPRAKPAGEPGVVSKAQRSKASTRS